MKRHQDRARVRGNLGTAYALLALRQDDDGAGIGDLLREVQDEDCVMGVLIALTVALGDKVYRPPPGLAPDFHDDYRADVLANLRTHAAGNAARADLYRAIG